jgi:diguanylate cyclase (GGDEF)-like protein
MSGCHSYLSQARFELFGAEYMTYQFSDSIRKFLEQQKVPMAVYQSIDGKAVTVLVSDGFCALHKDSREHMVSALNQSMFERVDQRDAGMLAELGRKFAEHEKPYDVVYRAFDESGHKKTLHTVGFWQTMPDGTELAFLFYTDISKSSKLIEENTRQYFGLREDHFYTDPLTKQPNLNFLYEFGNEKINAIRLRQKQPVLIYFDVDAMENYNNQYGYAAGNDLLCLVAEILKDYYPDAQIARGYDDHFQVITELSQEENTARSCDDRFQVITELSQEENTINRVNQEVIRRAEGNTTGLKAGICILTESDTINTALDHARDAYKTIGFDLNHSLAVYSPKIEEEYSQQRYIVNHFDEALSKRWIRVFYQGIVESDHCRICHCEALSRWIDPDQGMISPGKFIPVLRKYHLTYKLDLFMVEEVCREYAKRKEKGLPLVPVSVNLSAQDFDHADMFREITALLRKYDVPTENIVIEITEQDLAESESSFIHQLDLFRNHGFRIWCDDFGSGYSNLTVFTRYQCDLIKLDQSLMKNLDQPNKIIIRAIVQAAKELGIATLSEGVEAEEQYQFAKEAGIDFVQGFYFYKPQPLE